VNLNLTLSGIVLASTAVVAGYALTQPVSNETACSRGPSGDSATADVVVGAIPGVTGGASEAMLFTVPVVSPMGAMGQGECAADFDGDLQIDFKDLTTLLANWGPCLSAEDCLADVDDSGQIDAQDLAAVLAAWGPCQ
jgi:hypothetical protein